MGKPKKKPKQEIEANEFLKGLMEEVQSLEDDADEVISDENSSEYKSATAEEEEQGSPQGLSDGNSNDEDLPTIFANMRKEIKAPSLRKDLSGDPNYKEPSIRPAKQSEKTVASLDADPESQQDTAAQTSTSQETFAQNTESVQNTSTVPATTNATILNVEPDRTVAVEGARGSRGILQEKVATGALKGTRSGQVYTSLDASLAQAETLKIAQSRIKELENEIDRLRQENDDLSSAGDVVTRRMEDYQVRVQRLEKEKSDLSEQAKSERAILKGNLQFKETELSKTKAKLEDLEMRIKTDFRKIRVRERELENRLELVRGEKQALMRAKDEKILDLQRKLDQYKTELDLYRTKVQDLNKMMESQHDQMQKTIRALRVALVNLEPPDVMDETNVSGRDSSRDGREDNEELKKAK